MMQPRSRNNRGYTLLEMLTTLAALAIVLGLMVSLARHVRDASAMQLTKRLLRQLDGLMSQYEARYHTLPHIAPVVISDADLRRMQTLMGFRLPGVRDYLANAAELPSTEQNERAVQEAALENNRQFLRALRPEGQGPVSDFSSLSDAIYNHQILRDAWGKPIVYIPTMHSALGVALQDRRFFLSAGPGRKFLAREGQLYSYEEAGHTE